MLCSNCGKQINDGARFCEFCGATQTPAKAKCVNCGGEINFGAKFCEHCGATQPIDAANVPAVTVPKSNSKYSQEEQSNIVGIAATLEASIKFEKEELKRLTAEGFREQPQKVEEIAAWSKELDSWMSVKQAKLVFVENDLKENIDALDELYTSTKLIPSAYRAIDKLMWLYEDMSTSEHDLERSIDMLNHKETSDLLRNMNDNVDEVKSALAVGFTAVYSAIQQNNMIQSQILSNQQYQQEMMQQIISNQNAAISQQSEMMTNLSKIRKSARTGNFLNIGSLIQNHKRNKMLSNIQDGLK